MLAMNRKIYLKQYKKKTYTYRKESCNFTLNEKKEAAFRKPEKTFERKL